MIIFHKGFGCMMYILFLILSLLLHRILPCHVTKIIFKILPHVISSTGIFLKWLVIPYFLLIFFHLPFMCNQSAKNIKNLSLRNIWKNAIIALHRNTRKKVTALKALCFGRSRYHFLASFFISRHFLERVSLNHRCVCLVCHITRKPST